MLAQTASIAILTILFLVILSALVILFTLSFVILSILSFVILSDSEESRLRRITSRDHRYTKPLRTEWRDVERLVEKLEAIPETRPFEIY